MNLIFDGSYAGFLTSIFECFDRKIFDAKIIDKDSFVPSFFDDELDIITDPEKANRVLTGLKSKLKPDFVKQLYWVFLSEDQKARNALLYIIQSVFKNQINILDNFGDERVLYFHQMFTKVRRERHRMKAFIRFQKSNDGMFYCMIEPDFNVLPLILSFFKKRYADQAWLIYDVKRKYGMYYNLNSITEIYLTPTQNNAISTQTTSIVLDNEELHFQNLWKQYFKSTNIEARRNMKLHLQHVPRRYWKYLTEKD